MKRAPSHTKKIRILPVVALVLLLASVPFIIRSLQHVSKTEAAWYNDLWAYRVKLTIDDAKVGGANEVFDIGHETGTTSQYSSTTTDGGDLSVSSAAALNSSSYGLSMLIDDTNLLQAERTLTKSTRVRYRFYFDPNSVTMANNDHFVLSSLEQNGGGYNNIVYTGVGYTTVGGYTLHQYGNNDAGSQVLNDSVTISDAPHYIEVLAIQATNATSNDGSYEWWVDGVSQGTATGVDNYNNMFDQNWRFFFQTQNLDAGTSGTVYADDFVANSDGTPIGPVLTDFPVYVDLSMLPSGFHSHVNQTDARDIRVTKGDGTTELPREIVNYDASRHTGEIHIKYSGTLSSSSDTPIYIYYGNPNASEYSASDTYGRNNVWDSNFKAVQHLNIASTGAADEFVESTSNGNHLSGDGTASRRPSQTTGKVHTAQNFVSSAAQYLSRSSTSGMGTMNASQTVSLWYKTSSNPVVSQHPFCLENSAYTIHSCMYFDGSGNIGVGSDWNSPFTQWIATAVPTAGSWHHIVWTWDGTTNRLYVNGSEATSNTTAPGVSATVAHYWVGAAQSSNDTVSKFTGDLDEVQFSATQRTATWVSTQYNNQNNPSTFFISSSKEEKRTAAVLYLTFDEGTGTTAYDSSANGYNGTLSGATVPAWQTEDRCISGKCLYYNGSTAYTSVTTSIPSVQSVSFWVRPKTTSETLMDFDGGTHYLSASSGTITATGFSSPTIYVNGVSGGSLVANAWQHVEVTTGTVFAASALTIGKQSSSYLNGFIDEFKVYDYARTSSQVKQDYTARSAYAGVAARIGPDTGSVLSNGLVGYWKMDEASWTVNCSTTSVTDSSGVGNNGTACPNSTGPTGGIIGKFGNAGNFDGSNDYIQVADSNSLDLTTNFTLSAWIYPTTLTGDRHIFSKDGASDTDDAYNFFVQDSGWICYETNNRGNNICTDDPEIVTNKWQHVVVVFDNNATQKAQIYVDGKMKVMGSGTTQAPVALTTALLIGKRGNAGQEFQGKIDDARVYNRSFSPSEVRQLYDWAPGPVGHWKMDENVGTTFSDISGNEKPGSFVGSPEWSRGRFGSGLKLNGTTDYLQIASPSLPTRDFTYEIWMYATNISGSRAIFMASSSSGSGNEFFVEKVSTAQLIVQLDSTGSDIIAAPDVLAANTWQHIAITRSDSLVSAYINGVLVGTGTSAAVLNFGSCQLLVGMDNDGSSCNGTPSDYFGGTFDDLRIYNYARTHSQVVEDMNGGHPPGGSPVESDIIHWKFDEASGATANNAGYGGSGYNGTISGATWYPGGKLGSAVATSTSTNFVSAGDQAFVDSLKGMTVGMWVKPISLATNKALISKSNMSSQNAFALVTDNSSSDEIRVHIPTSVSDTSTYFLTSNLDLSNDSWSYVNVIYNASESASTRVRVYKNGKEVSGSVTGTLPDKMTTGTTSLLKVGASDSGSYTALSAVFDDIKIYPYALTYDQMLIDYNGKNSIVLGSLSTDSDGITASNSATREFCVPGDTSSCAPPILRWAMDENVGTTSIVDSSGNGYLGTMNGSMTTSDWVQGARGSALNFDGTDDSVQNSSVSLPTGDFTYSIWIYPTAFTASNAFIGLPQATIGGNEFQVDTDTDGDIDVVLDNGATLINGTNGLITLNKWHHIVITRIGSTVTSYINGKQDLTGIDGDALSLASCGVRIGRNQSSTTCSSAGSNNYQGRLDDLQVYNYGRTPAQIAWDYNRGAPVAWYKFDECTGSIAYNSAPTASGQSAGMNGTIAAGSLGNTATGSCSSGTSTEMWNDGTSGKYSGSMGFDGSDDSVTISNVTNIDLNNGLANGFTFAAWVYPQSSGESGNGRVFSKGPNSGASNGSANLRVSTDTGSTVVVGGQLDMSTTDCDQTFGTIPINAWSHLAFSYSDDSDDDATVWINGTPNTCTASGSIAAESYDVYVGGNGTGTNNTRTFDGRIDDFRVYNYELTPAQMKSVMNDGAVRFGP